MRYFGSKTSVVKDVYKIVSGNSSNKTLCDPFGGIGVVSNYFKKKGYTVWSSDILLFPFYFQVSKIQRNKPCQFKNITGNIRSISSRNDLVEYLNNQKVGNTWFEMEYSHKRSFFKPSNARHIAACWKQIKYWDEADLLNSTERAVLLSSLINSMDKVANTAGTYYAYLKDWYRKSENSFKFEMMPFTEGNKNCKSFNTTAKELVDKRYYDVIYLDPPYNERCYSRYYHLPETIARMEKPSIHGKSGVPDKRRTTSKYNNSSTALQALTNLIQSAEFKVLALHYTNNGIINTKDIENILSNFRNTELHKLKNMGYSIEGSRGNNHLLYVVRK